MDELYDDFNTNGGVPAQEMEELKRKLKAAEENYELLQKQTITLSQEANRKNNDLQNQLQGVESVSQISTAIYHNSSSW